MDSKEGQNPKGPIPAFLQGMPGHFAQLKLGTGVVGNTTTGLVAAMVAVMVALFALRSEPVLAIVAATLILIVYLIYMRSTHNYADRHPDSAMLGGGEWLKWFESSQSASNMLALEKENPVIEAPLQPLPLRDAESIDGV